MRSCAGTSCGDSTAAAAANNSQQPATSSALFAAIRDSTCLLPYSTTSTPPLHVCRRGVNPASDTWRSEMSSVVRSDLLEGRSSSRCDLVTSCAVKLDGGRNADAKPGWFKSGGGGGKVKVGGDVASGEGCGDGTVCVWLGSGVAVGRGEGGRPAGAPDGVVSGVPPDWLSDGPSDWQETWTDGGCVEGCMQGCMSRRRAGGRLIARG